MLMNIENSIVQSLKVSLTFDNNKTKEREISVGDLCYFEFNKNGARKTIEGKVVKINCNNTSNSNSWVVIVDGSLDFKGQMERISPNNILDVDIIQKHDAKGYIGTPNDSSRITDMRLVNGYLQVSTDGGYSWTIPKNYAGRIMEDSEMYPQHNNQHCNGQRPNKKPIHIEDYEEDYITPGDVIEDESY